MPDMNADRLRRIVLLERSLKEIVNLAEKHPDNMKLQQARILAEAGLNAPSEDQRSPTEPTD